MELKFIFPYSGTFNTFVFRITALVSLCVLQAWLMMNFITFQLKKRREDAANVTFALPSSGGKSKKTQQEKAKARKEKPKKEANKDYEDDNELPEVDQNTKQSLRQRKWKTK